MDPNKLQQLIFDVCDAIIDESKDTKIPKEAFDKAVAIKEQFKPIRQKLTPEIYKALWDIIQDSDFILLCGGVEQEILNQNGLKNAELKSMMVGRAELYNFGNAIAYMCMQGAQQGMADSAVDFLKRANQMAMANVKQIPVVKPKIEIVS